MGRSSRAVSRAFVLAAVSVVMTGCLDVAPPGQSEPKPTSVADLKPVRADSVMGGLAAAQVRVADNALRRRDFEIAERMYREARKAAPEMAAPLIGLGESLYAQGRYPEAVDAFRAGREKDSASTEAREGLAKSLIANGAHKEALALLEIAAKERPSAQILNKLGVARDLSGDGDGAQTAYRAALDLEPKNRSARNNLALSLAISALYPDAVAEMERVMQLAPNDERYRGNLAFVYGMSGDIDGVVRINGGADAAERARLTDRFSLIREMAKAGDRMAVLAMIDTTASAAKTSRVASVERSETNVDADAPADDAPAQSSVEAAGTEPKVMKEKENIASAGAGTISAKMAETSPAVAAGMDPAKPAQRVAALTPPVKAETAASAKPYLAGTGEWRVQLAAYRTKGHTERGLKIFMARAGDIVPSIEGIVRRDAEPGQVSYRLRTPSLPDKAAAASLCKMLQERGLGCLVIRHAPDIWVSTG